MEASAGSYADPGATCTEANPPAGVQEDQSARVAVSGQVVNLAATGTYTLRYNCQPPGGLAAVEAQRVVTVQDTTPPLLAFSPALETSPNQVVRYGDRAKAYQQWPVACTDAPPFGALTLIPAVTSSRDDQPYSLATLARSGRYSELTTVYTVSYDCQDLSGNPAAASPLRYNVTVTPDCGENARRERQWYDASSGRCAACTTCSGVGVFLADCRHASTTGGVCRPCTNVDDTSLYEYTGQGQDEFASFEGRILTEAEAAASCPIRLRPAVMAGVLSQAKVTVKMERVVVDDTAAVHLSDTTFEGSVRAADFSQVVTLVRNIDFAEVVADDVKLPLRVEKLTLKEARRIVAPVEAVYTDLEVEAEGDVSEAVLVSVEISGSFQVAGVKAVNVDARRSKWIGPGPTTHGFMPWHRRLLSQQVFNTQASIAGTDFAGGNFSQAVFANVNATGVSFAGADLTQAYMAYVDFGSANFSNANLGQANFTGSSLEGADLSQANLPSHLIGTVLRGATLAGADLSGTDLTQADLDGVASGQTVRFDQGAAPLLPQEWSLGETSCAAGACTATLSQCAAECDPSSPLCGCMQYAASCEASQPAPLSALGVSACTPGSPCQACQGDCDNDADCAPGLQCMQRSGDEAVLGCTGAGLSAYDYCYNPLFPATTSASSKLQCLQRRPVSCTDAKTAYRTQCCGLAGETVVASLSSLQDPLAGPGPVQCQQLYLTVTTGTCAAACLSTSASGLFMATAA